MDNSHHINPIVADKAAQIAGKELNTLLTNERIAAIHAAIVALMYERSLGGLL
jgi:hypothetical protein